jgi:hypothetical protein
LYSYNTGYPCTPTTTDSDTLNNLSQITLSLAKGQLAGAVIILVSALVFVGIYVYVYIRALRDNERVTNNTFPIPRQYVPSSHPQDTVSYNGNSQIIICPKCGTSLETTARFKKKINLNYFQ